MCSFIFSNREITDSSNFFSKKRGPDFTNSTKIDKYYFLHNLLSISKKFSVQPLVNKEKDIVLLYNGEIYNSQNYENDGEIIIPKYLDYGFNLPNTLDGEFALCLLDIKKNKLLISTDLFATKPLWLAIEEQDIGVATYQSSLKELGFTNPKKIPANTKYFLDLENNKFIEKGSVYKFILDQYKTTFEDWNLAFEKSIRKRTNNCDKKIFIGLSSGYDSGAIACELNKQNVEHSVFTINGRENLKIIKKRTKLFNENVSFNQLNFNFLSKFTQTQYINKNVESFEGFIYNSDGSFNLNLNIKEDRGGRAFSYICNKAKEQNHKIFLSGSGADEIFSDYGFSGNKFYKHSNFGGLFPNDLNKIFPWPSFYSSSQEAYIAKEELIGGAYGIELRYPFLDKDVVQEFLALDSKLKNSNYKSVLNNYLTKNNYPFEKERKIGLQ